eukprot:Nitzschia sp. Nitz4//scaffold235_size30605//11159//12016//NITZ4_007974-RA/size30605-augustus-gene-0.0-mRNA-1//1//CDS//3329543450//6980//frame0
MYLMIFPCFLVSLSRTTPFIYSRAFSPSVVCLDDLPYHIVVGMPALSPTMETGILAEWYVEAGSEFTAGQAIAKIETDKASMDFEAQDDGFVAKILMEAGTGADVAVGTPIMVTVEESDDVGAFANFEAPAEAAPEPAAPAPAADPAPTPTPAPVVEAPPAPTHVVAAAPEPVAEAPVATPPPADDLIAAVAPVLSTKWGEFVKINSPILKTLSKQQTSYNEMYGTTGQVPL